MVCERVALERGLYDLGGDHEKKYAVPFSQASQFKLATQSHIEARHEDTLDLDLCAYRA